MEAETASETAGGSASAASLGRHAVAASSSLQEVAESRAVWRQLSAVFSEADADALHVELVRSMRLSRKISSEFAVSAIQADEAYCIGLAASAESYVSCICLPIEVYWLKPCSSA